MITNKQNTDWFANHQRKVKKTILQEKADTVRNEIIRRRRQMLVHSCIYYVLNDNLIDDHIWQAWADQLTQLHRKYGEQVNFYDEAFKGWDGSTGFHLPFDPSIVNVAKRLLANTKVTISYLLP